MKKPIIFDRLNSNLSNFYPCFLIFSMLIFLSCSQKSIIIEKNENEYIITDVFVIPMIDNTILENQNVWIKDGKILSVNAETFPKTANIIDGKGKYLIPGLTEMHAHIPTAKDGDDSLVKETLFLYLSQGVTKIRGMLGDPYHLELRTAADNEKILSPRIYTSSPSLNGNSIPTPEEAIAKVTQYQKDGYDFLKIHPGIKLEVWKALEKTAKQVNIPYAGHVPTGVGIHRALEAQYKTIDHLDGYLEGLVPESEHVDPDANGFFGYGFTPLLDASLISELVTKTLKNNVAIVPTQTLFSRWFSPVPIEELANENEMKYISSKMMFTWRQMRARFAGGEDFTKEQWEKFMDIRIEILKEMDQRGVTFLLGSDAPQAFNVPGFSIHHEMREMSKIGISNFKILQSGTINPALFFKTKGHEGTIITGAPSDLILLNENPLEDIRNTQKIEGVMIGKNWLSKEIIQSRLNKIAIAYEN